MISPILVIIGISNVIGKQFLLPTQQQGPYTVSIVVGASVNLILNIVLINYLDAMGASIATVLAEVMVTLVQIWYVRKQLPLKECFKPIFKYFFLGVVMCSIVWWSGKVLPSGIWSLCIMIGVGIVVYALELIISKDQLVYLGLNLIKKENEMKVWKGK